jgi:hypothetical protein
VVQRAESLYGPQMAIIDSSKQIANLSTLVRELPELEVIVLHNIKDVRAFAISMIDNSIRKNRHSTLPENFFLEWYRTNRAVDREARRILRQPPLRVAYEAICFATQSVATRVSEALGARYIDPDAALNSGASHIISGNRFRLSSPTNAANLVYDCRWFGRSEWLRPYLLMPMVRRYNEKCFREWSDAVEGCEVDADIALTLDRKRHS